MLAMAAGSSKVAEIDPISNLAETPIYVYGGATDTVILKGVVDKTAKFF